MSKEKLRTLIDRLEKCVEQIETEATVSESQQVTDIEKIIQIVAAYYGITPSQLRARSRAHVYCWPRHVAVYFARNHTRFSLHALALRFGYENHGTVLHAVERIKTALEINDRGARQEIDELSAILNSKLNERVQQPRSPIPQLSQKAA
jgi:chromosomal replication initiation ATPase DnaA